MRIYILLFILPLILLSYQNCSDKGFIPLNENSFKNLDLDSITPDPDLTFDDMLKNSAYTFTEADKFYTVREAYSTDRGIGLNAFFMGADFQGDPVFESYRKIEIYEEDKQVKTSTMDYQLTTDHQVISSLRLGNGGQVITSYIGDGAARTRHINIYNAGGARTCTAEFVQSPAIYGRMAEANGIVYLFAQPVVNNIAQLRMLAFDLNCTEVFRKELVPADVRNLYVVDVDIAGTNLILSMLTETLDANGNLITQPILNIFDLQGNFVRAEVYDSPDVFLGELYVQVSGTNIILFGNYVANQFASPNFMHMKVSTALQVQGAFGAGHESIDSASGSLAHNGTVYVFGTMEHPQSNLEALFYYQLDPVAMTVKKQVVIDSKEADLFTGAALLRDKYLGITLNVGDGSGIIFVDDSGAEAPKIEGFDTFTDNLTFTPLNIQSVNYPLVVQ